MLARERLEERLREAFPDARLEVVDLTGTSDHYELHMGSERFSGLARVNRHRLVYQALGEHMRADIHALALHTYTPEEWNKRD